MLKKKKKKKKKTVVTIIFDDKLISCKRAANRYESLEKTPI